MFETHTILTATKEQFSVINYTFQIKGTNSTCVLWRTSLFFALKMFTRIVQVSQFEVPCVPTRFPCLDAVFGQKQLIWCLPKLFFLFLFVCAVYTHVNTPSLNVGNVCCHRVASLKSDSPVPSHISTMKYIQRGI